MPVVKKSSAAEQDICDMLLYVGHEDRSPTGALRLLEAFEAAFELYAANPLLGTPRPEFGENDRAFSCGTKSNPHGWLVIYCPIPDGIHILRVFRAARDYKKLF